MDSILSIWLLRGDIVAGITLAAYLLRAGLSDVSLANLPPQAGLSACPVRWPGVLVVSSFATHCPAGYLGLAMRTAIR
jgi:MFS superfamily sulfate permease-like transporter